MLDKIANMYYKTEGDMKRMWKKKWYQGVKNVARRYESMLPTGHKDRLK
jgi:hypothetical protein